MRLRRISLILVLLLILIAFTACSDTPDDTECTAHVDANSDGKCDECGAVVEKLPCTECKDSDGDDKCDTCGESMPEEEPCTECKDSDGDGKCDACGSDVAYEIVLINNKEACFHFVIGDGCPGTVVMAVDKLKNELKGKGITVLSVEDKASTEADGVIEVLVGSVSSRGDKYVVDEHKYGAEGFGIELIDGKILLIGGSVDYIDEAVEAFRTEVLNLEGSRVIKNVKIMSDFKYQQIQDDYRVNTITLFGEDIRGYKIAVDSSVKSAYTAAKKLQSLFYKSTGYWFDLTDADTAENVISIELVEKTGGEGLYATFNKGSISFSCEYTTSIQTEIYDFFNRKITLSTNKTLAFSEADSFTKNVRDVYYKSFGAVADGKTDDLAAIIAAHKYANEGGHRVIATPGTYYIGNNDGLNHFEGAIIMTDTDWRGAKFIIDDSKIDKDALSGNKYARQCQIFSIRSSVPSQTIPGANLAIDSLPKSSTNIGYAPGKPALVLITNKNQKNYIRQGVNTSSGEDEKEVVLVDAEGNIDPSTPLTWDYETITSYTIYNIDDAPITVQGGFFETIYNRQPNVYEPFSRGIWIYRSNVTLKDIEHLNSGEGETGCPSGGFTIFNNCTNVTFENIVYDNMKSFYTTGTSGSGTAVMGSYEISGHNCVNMTWKNCTQRDFWTDETKTYAANGGIMGSSFCKDLNFYDCELSSFDAHCGVQDVTLVRCKFEHVNCIGGGTAYLEDTTIYTIYQKNAIMLRSDYGSIWMGDFIFKNCTLVTGDTVEVALFDGGWANHDYGYDFGARMPTNVTVENITIKSNNGLKTLKLVEQFVYMTGSGEKPDKALWSVKVWEDTVDGVENINKYKITEKWTVIDDKGYEYLVPPNYNTIVNITSTAE